MAFQSSAIRTILAGCLFACSALTAAAQDQLPWAESYEQACQQANAQGKLVLLHFYSDNCPPCVRLERNVFNQPEVGAAVGRSYVPLKIHAEKNQALASKFHVAQWPTDVIIKPDGTEITRSISPQTPTAYINLTNSVAASAGISAAQNSGTVAGATSALPAVPNGQWLTSAAQNSATQLGNQANAQASWMAASAATAAQQAQQNGQQAWQTTQGQVNQAVSNTNQYAQQMQQQAVAASNQAAQNLQQSTQNAAAQAQQVVNQYAQPWQAPAAGGWQPPFSAPATGAAPGAAPNAAPQQQFTSTQPPAYTVPPAAAGAASPYDTNPALSPQAAAAVAANYPIAMGGYCPVTLATEKKWKKGQPQFGAVHRRRTFLFTSEADQKKFLAEPDKFTPVLVGYDPVKFMQTGELVDGTAAFSLTYRKEVYLFADDASLKTFWQNPAQFTEGLRQAMNRTDGRTLR